MSKPKTKSQIADHLAENTKVNKKTALQLLDSLTAFAYKEAKNSFAIPGLGKLVLVKRKARMGRDPRTGEATKIPARQEVKFVVTKAAKDAILGKR